MTMTAKDLMVYDWCMLPGWEEPTQISYSQMTLICAPYSLSAEIEPIPLTDDILKENFVFNELGRYEIGEHLKGRKGQPDRGLDGYIIFRLDGIAECSMWSKCCNMSVNVNYVHELQHALRLCGLSELANNFKIN